MNTKLIIAATFAALTLGTSAFAAEGGRQDQSYATAPIARFDNTVLPEDGAQGAVQTANSLPKGAMEGTAAYVQAQSVNRWFAQQDAHRFAQQQLRHAHLNG